MNRLLLQDVPADAQTAASLLRGCLRKAHSDAYCGGTERLYGKLQRAGEQLAAATLSAAQMTNLRSLPIGTDLELVGPLAVQAVPWECLRLDNEWLGERFSLTRCLPDNTSTSASACPVPATSSQPAPHPETRFRKQGSIQVVVANSPELISASAERVSVTRQLRYLHHDHPAQFAEPTTPRCCPNRDEFLALWSRLDWLHFAGHAISRKGVRELVLASAVPDSVGDPAVTPTDLADRGGAPAFAVLNACGALELPESGAAEATLLAVMLKLGSRWLVGPTVPVRDQQTRNFVDELYRSLIAGSSVAAATRAARLESVRRWGRFNLVGLSYVAYGGAETSPLNPTPAPSSIPKMSAGASVRIPAENITQESNTMLNPSGTLSEINKPPSSPAEILLPTTCRSCGRQIETQDGVGRLLDGKTHTVLCWKCHRATFKDSSRETPVSAHHPLPTSANAPASARQNDIGDVFAHAGAAAPDSPAAPEDVQPDPLSSDRPARENRELHADLSVPVRAFIQHAEECFSRTLQVPRMTDDGTTQVRFQPRASDSRRHAGVCWSGEWTITSADDETSSTAILLIPQLPGPQEFSGPAADPAETSEAPLVTAEQLQQITETAARVDGGHRYLFIAAPQGFTDDARKFATDDTLPLGWSSDTTVYLYDISKEEIEHRKSDVRSWTLAHVLNRSSTGRQFVQAVRFLQNGLPLTTSLSADTVARENNLEIDAVEAAMRLTAFQHSLQLERTDEFGFVLSEHRPLSSPGTADHRTGRVQRDRPSLLRRLCNFFKLGQNR